MEGALSITRGWEGHQLYLMKTMQINKANNYGDKGERGLIIFFLARSISLFFPPFFDGGGGTCPQYLAITMLLIKNTYCTKAPPLNVVISPIMA